MDKSWGGGTTGRFWIRTNESPEERAAKRALERQVRSGGRAAAIAHRLEVRAASREADMAARERARIERREQEQRSTSGDPHAAAARRHRTSGRKDVVKDQRDTRSYVTVVDEDRIRELARRGASVSGLADAFTITEADVVRILADDIDRS